MTQLAERLGDLAAAGRASITFEDLGLPAQTLHEQVQTVAAGPLAPRFWPKRSPTPATSRTPPGPRPLPPFPLGWHSRAVSWPSPPLWRRCWAVSPP